jgi:integrase/recombinase XerD
VHPHMLRHTFVTTMLDAGVDLRDVQIAARHADPRTTMRSARAGPHQPGPAPELHPGRLHVLSNLTSLRLPGSSPGGLSGAR